MGLLSILGTGTRALTASQLGMDVTGQNISNADVDGYSRKVLNQTADYRYDSQFGQMGYGVDVISIERMRNEQIDAQIRSQNQTLGYYEKVDYALGRVENIFTEPSDTGLQKFIDQFFDSWQNLSNNPADLSARTMVKTNGEILTNVIQNLSNELRDLRESFNTDIAAEVERVNQISAELYNLNQEIATVEVNGQNANDSRDTRDELLKELSKIIDIQVIENEHGQVSVSTAGSLIVSPVFSQKIKTSTVTYNQPDGTTRLDIGLVFETSKRVYNPINGSIRGLLDNRDIYLPDYEEKLDTLVNSLVSQVNEQHESGYNLMGYSGISFFDPSTTGASDMELSASIKQDIKNIAAASGGRAQLANTNVIAAGAGTLNFGNAAAQLSRTSGSVNPVLTDEARNIVAGSVQVTASGATLTEGVDYHIDYVQGTIQMLHGGFDNQALNIDFEYRTGGFQGPGDNSNSLLIAQLRDTVTMEPNVIGENTSTFTEYYASFIGQLGLNRSEAASNLETREFLVEQYNTQQDAIAGVSLDEEMANLVKFQHTFTAAARLITITDQMLDVLMNI